MIQSFSELPKLKNTLYVIDIDDTIMYYENNNDKDILKSIEKFEATMDKSDAFVKANKVWEQNLQNEDPLPTDKKGLNQLNEFCKSNNSSIIFLTARFEHIRPITEKHVKSLYPWIKEQDIYMCTGKSKGEVLQSILYPPSDIVFVDDKQYNIDSIKHYFPSSLCFKFNYN